MLQYLSFIQAILFYVLLSFLASFLSLVTAIIYFETDCLRDMSPKKVQSQTTVNESLRVENDLPTSSVPQGTHLLTREQPPPIVLTETGIKDFDDTPKIYPYELMQRIAPSWYTEGLTVYRPNVAEVKGVGRIKEEPESGPSIPVKIPIIVITPPDDDTVPVESSLEPVSTPPTIEDTNDEKNDDTVSSGVPIPNILPRTKTILPTIEENFPLHLPVVHDTVSSSLIISDEFPLISTGSSSSSSDGVSSGSILSSEMAPLMGNKLRPGTTSPVCFSFEEGLKFVTESLKIKPPDDTWNFEEPYSPKFPISSSGSSNYEFPCMDVVRQDFPQTGISYQHFFPFKKKESSCIIEIPSSVDEKSSGNGGDNAVKIDIPDDPKPSNSGSET